MSTPAVALFRAAALPLQATPVAPIPSTLSASIARAICRIETPVTSHCVFPGRFPSRLIRESARFRLFSHTHAEITCQEAHFLHPTEIAGSRRALPRVFASVIIWDNQRRRQCGLVRAYGAENVTRNTKRNQHLRAKRAGCSRSHCASRMR